MKRAAIVAQTLSTEKEAYWEHHAQQCAESGLSKLAYCKQQNIQYPRFIYWSKKFAEPVLPDLVAVKIKPDIKVEKMTGEIRCTLQLKNNSYLHIESQQALLTVLAQLG